MQSSAVIYAKRLDPMADFYAGVFDLTVAERDPGDFVLLMSDDAGLELTIVALPPAIAENVEVSSPPSRRESTPIKLSISVDDLTSARSLAVGLGGALDDPETQWSWRGWSRCNGHDPEGNVFEVRLREPD